ncbi:MAG: hypothetical protein R3D71_03545 [Rickettsiales bacterium]
MTPPPISQNAMADLLCTIMILCRGNSSDGKPCWAYMCIKPSMAKSFKEARDKGNLNLEEFGTIIEHGDGQEPSEEVKHRMETEYGMNHNYENDLLRAIENIEQKNAIA